MGLPVETLTRTDIVEELTRGARERLGPDWTARQLIDAYQAGALEDPGVVADLIALAHLLREDDELFAGLRPSRPVLSR